MKFTLHALCLAGAVGCASTPGAGPSPTNQQGGTDVGQTADDSGSAGQVAEGGFGNCDDPQYFAIPIDDDGVKKVVCAPDYPIWGIGPESPAGFHDNTDGTVSHTLTALTWQQVPYSGPTTTVSWYEAAKYCDGLILAGHTDWRLPTRAELLSIVQFATFDPSIDKKVFPGAVDYPVSSDYWTVITGPTQDHSSSTGIAQDETAWQVDFAFGDVQLKSRALSGTHSGAVRCVR